MTKIENLPAKLRETGLFCCWRYEEGAGDKKPRKVPYNPRTGGRAQSNNPDTFAPLEVAMAASGSYDGLGVGVFNSLGAIDIDHCIEETGEISEMAVAVMSKMQAYTEYSPSGRGLRILFNASGFQYDKAKYYIKNDDLGLEVYIAGNTSRFVTLTGNTLTSDWDLEERGEQLAEVLEKYMIRPAKATPPVTPRKPVELDDLGLIEQAKRGRNGTEFTALWAGDTSAYGGDESRADLALCNALAWWTNRDAERVDRLFRQSGLMREKWDRPTAGSTYGAITVQEAVDTCTGGYAPEAYRRQAVQGGDALDWGDEIGSGQFAPLDPFKPPDTSALPVFPVECLPPVLRDMATAAAENLQVAVDMAAVAELAIISLCVQGKFIINPKPGWLEQLNLYTAIVARPSDRKTPVLSLLSRPVYAFEKEENERRAPQVEEYRTKRKVLLKKIANLEELAAKPTPSRGKPVSMDDITELQYELADLEREAVNPLRLLADDTTPEALASLMAANDGRMGIVSDEGGVFDILAGKYSNGKANLDVFLKAYSGAPIRIDRKGRPPEAIDHPTLTMLLMVQPVVLEAIMGNQDFAGRGFLARPLYSMPLSTVGHRIYESAPISPQVEGAYNFLVQNLLAIQDIGEARIIRVTPETHQEAKRFFEALELRLADDLGDLGDLEGWGGKLHGQVMRVAGVLHCCIYTQQAAQVPLSVETMQAAETIGEYFLSHAKAAFQIMGLLESQETKDAKYILKRMKEDGKTEISKRDLYQLCNGKFSNVESMEAGLNVLVKRGYLCISKVKTGGRPTEKIYMNPELQKVQKLQKPLIQE